jgi:hypothetical protein
MPAYVTGEGAPHSARGALLDECRRLRLRRTQPTAVQVRQQLDQKQPKLLRVPPSFPTVSCRYEPLGNLICDLDGGAYYVTTAS